MQTEDHELLFQIPDGFNNNIIWLIGHCITSLQRHMYMRSGLPMCITDEFMHTFKIGSAPRFWTTAPDLEEIKHLLIYTVDQLESDLKSEIFVHYTPFTLPIGFTISNHIQALQAANFHEAEHSGQIFTYLKILHGLQDK